MMVSCVEAGIGRWDNSITSGTPSTANNRFGLYYDVWGLVRFTCGVPIRWCVIALYRFRHLCLHVYVCIYIYIYLYVYTSLRYSSHIYVSLYTYRYKYIYSCTLCVFLCLFSCPLILATIIDRTNRCTTIYELSADDRSSLPEQDAASSSSATAASSSSATGGAGKGFCLLRLRHVQQRHPTICAGHIFWGRMPVFTKVMARSLLSVRNSLCFVLPSSSSVTKIARNLFFLYDQKRLGTSVSTRSTTAN